MFAQQAGGGVAATVIEAGEVHLHQAQAGKVGQKISRVVARLDAHGGGIGLIEKRIDGDGGNVGLLVLAKAQLHVVASGAQIEISHKAPP